MNANNVNCVFPAALANARFGRAAVRHAVGAGRWQRPLPGVVVTHSGPLSVVQRRHAVVIRAGANAALTHATGAEMAGLVGFSSPCVHVTIPVGMHARSASGVVVHHSRVIDRDVHPTRSPRQLRLERCLLDIAATAATDRAARSVLAAAVAQRLTTAPRIRALLARFPTLPRHALITATLDDVEGGSHSLPELEFIAAIRGAGLPEPDRQAVWRRPDGRAYLDARWDAARLVVEIDGIGHLDPRTWIYDLERQNDLVTSGERVLRFPSFVVRTEPARVTARIRACLEAGRGLPYGS